MKARKLKRYKIHFAKDGNTFNVEVDAHTIQGARLLFKDAYSYDHIFYVKLMTNKNNHL